MAKRLLFEAEHRSALVKAYWDSTDREYSVRLWCGGTERKNAVYFTDDKDDAIGTAQAMLLSNNCGRSLGRVRKGRGR